MPAGTPPQKVLAAVKAFAREEFGAKHRYAMVLHTDEPHPHVHMVVKAVSEEGVRLNIKKATLRDWRREFARHLREQGVAANATDRQVRGVVNPQKTDGIHRAAMRGASTHWRQRTAAVAREANRQGVELEPGRRACCRHGRKSFEDGGRGRRTRDAEPEWSWRRQCDSWPKIRRAMPAPAHERRRSGFETGSSSVTRSSPRTPVRGTYRRRPSRTSHSRSRSTPGAMNLRGRLPRNTFVGSIGNSANNSLGSCVS
jgi:hypothetical protein